MYIHCRPSTVLFYFPEESWRSDSTLTISFQMNFHIFIVKLQTFFGYQNFIWYRLIMINQLMNNVNSIQFSISIIDFFAIFLHLKHTQFEIRKQSYGL